MKHIKAVFDVLLSLVAAWKIIVPLLAVLISVIVLVGENSLKIIDLSLPAWAIVILCALAAYPIFKFIEHIIRVWKKEPIALYGLLWKPVFLSFQYPKPICPYEGCECEVICKAIHPQPFKVVSSIKEITNTRFEYRYEYECPIHGVLSGIPNEDIKSLQYKAKKAMKK